MTFDEGVAWSNMLALVVGAAGLLLSVLSGSVASRSSRRGRLAALQAEIARASAELEAAQREQIELLQREPAPATVDDRLDRLMLSLRDSQSILDELQAELSARKLAVDRLRAEEEESRRLAALREEEAKAVRDLVTKALATAHADLQVKLTEEQADLKARLSDLQGKLDEAGKKGRRDQVLFFLSGALLSVPIGFLVNYLS